MRKPARSKGKIYVTSIGVAVLEGCLKKPWLESEFQPGLFRHQQFHLLLHQTHIARITRGRMFEVALNQIISCAQRHIIECAIWCS